MAQEKKTETRKANPVVKYLRETRGELNKVTWPTREESQRLTLIVLGVTALMAVFLGLLDFSFSSLMNGLIDLIT